MSRKAGFWKIFSIYCLVLALVLSGGLLVWRMFLADYEASRPEHPAQAFAAGLTPQDVCGAAAPFLDSLDAELQTRQEAEQVIAEAVTGELRAVREYAEEGEIRYHIYSGSQKIGAFRLKNEGKTAFRFPVWRAEDATFDLSFLLGPESGITVPEGAQVLFLGKKLPKTYVVRDHIPFQMFREFPQDGLPQLCTYRVRGYLGQPEWTVLTAEGVPVAEGDYEAVFSGSDCEGQEKDALNARVEKFLDQYIAYCGSNKRTARGNLYAMKKSLVPNGQLFQRLYSALDGLTFGQSLGDRRGATEYHCMKRVSESLYYVDVTYLVDTAGKKGVVQTTNNLKLLLVPNGEDFLVSDMRSY